LKRARLDFLIDEPPDLGTQQFMLLPKVDRTRLAIANWNVHPDPPRLVRAGRSIVIVTTPSFIT
jgi:hypothetical protein